MDTKLKILVCGDVEGRFSTLFNRVETINSKSGPFEMLLCIGNFFGINNLQFEEYKTGIKNVVIPTYILGPSKEDHLGLYPENESEICPNVNYLGKRGLYNTSGGLKIAYLSGIQTCGDKQRLFEFNKEDVTALRDMCLRGQPNFRGVDILLTSQWPKDVYNLDSNHKVKTEHIRESELLSWLATEVKPRYHVAGLEGQYYERPPYRVVNQHGERSEVATRFIGLARVANSEKAKWIYALSLTPVDRMRITDLVQQTVDETNSPYTYDILQNVKKDENVQYFYNMNTPEEKRKNTNRDGGQRKKQKPVFDQSKCWFCLSSPQVEKHLVISVGNESYLALAKGGLVDDHLLILPVEHHQSILTLPESVLEEIGKFKEALIKYYEEQNKVPIFFERNYKTSHCQVNVVPVPVNATKELADIFKDEAEGNGLKLEELEAHNRLEQVVQAGCPYFSVELRGATLYTRCRQDFPLQFGREVLAAGPVLNLPDRLDWRECSLSRTQEDLIVKKIRNAFEPYDFTL